MSKPKLIIDLRGPNGNVYAIVATVADALKRAGAGDRAAEFKELAFQQPSYEGVLELCKKYVEVTFIR